MSNLRNVIRQNLNVARLRNYRRIIRSDDKNEEKKRKSKKKKDDEETTKIVVITSKRIKYKFVKKYLKEGPKTFLIIHLITMSAFFSTFYAICESGYDIIEILDSFSLVESLKYYIEHSRIGSLSLALFLFKISMPFRYFFSILVTFLITRFGRKKDKDNVEKKLRINTIRAFNKIIELFKRRYINNKQTEEDKAQKELKDKIDDEKHWLLKFLGIKSKHHRHGSKILKIFGDPDKNHDHEVASAKQKTISRSRRVLNFVFSRKST